MSLKQQSKIPKGTLLVFMLLLFTSCSQLDFGIRWADTFVAYRINQQFDFEGDAKKSVKKETSSWVQSLRQTELPKMAQFLQSTADEAADLNWQNASTTGPWLEKNMQTIETYMDSWPQLIRPLALKIAILMQEKNWQNFQENFESESQKILKKPLDCTNRFKKTVQNWLGEINDPQIESLRLYCEARGNSKEVRVLNRRQMLSTFNQEVGTPFTNAHFQTALQKWLSQWQLWQHPESKALWQKSRASLLSTLSSIMKDATADQKKHFIKELNSQSEKLQRLAL